MFPGRGYSGKYVKRILTLFSGSFQSSVLFAFVYWQVLLMLVLYGAFMFLSVIPSICKEDANNRLIPPSKIIIVIIMQLATNNTAAAVVEVEDKDSKPFLYAPSIPLYFIHSYNYHS